MRKYSFSQRMITEWNKLPNDCVNASENCCTLDKPMASLSTGHLELVVWDGSLVKSCLISYDAIKTALKTSVASQGGHTRHDKSS